MSLHDDYARVTPFELVLQDDDEGNTLADTIAEEARGRGVDAADLGGFLTLGSVDAFVQKVAGDHAGAPALHRFGPLAYHAVRFVRAGRPLYLLSTHAARYLVEGVPGGTPAPPADAGYLQLPQHLFWTTASADAPESIDGIFWSVAPGDMIHCLAVTGVREDRPGLSVLPLPAAPLGDAPAWVDLQARETGQDFATELPGAEIDALYEIKATGELFKLLARFFAYVAATPGAVEMGAGADTADPTAAADAIASADAVAPTDPTATPDAVASADPTASADAIASADPTAPVDRDGPAERGRRPSPSRFDFARVTLGDPS